VTVTLGYPIDRRRSGSEVVGGHRSVDARVSIIRQDSIQVSHGSLMCPLKQRLMIERPHQHLVIDNDRVRSSWRCRSIDMPGWTFSVLFRLYYFLFIVLYCVSLFIECKLHLRMIMLQDTFAFASFKCVFRKSFHTNDLPQKKGPLQFFKKSHFFSKKPPPSLRAYRGRVVFVKNLTFWDIFQETLKTSKSRIGTSKPPKVDLGPRNPKSDQNLQKSSKPSKVDRGPQKLQKSSDRRNPRFVRFR
jgi:hypothetical protein